MLQNAAIDARQPGFDRQLKHLEQSDSPSQGAVSNARRLRRSKWAKSTPNPRADRGFLAGFIRSETYTAGQLSGAEAVEKFKAGVTAKLNDYPKQQEIEHIITALCEVLSVTKAVDPAANGSDAYLGELFSHLNTAPQESLPAFAEQVLRQMPVRAAIGIASPLLEEVMTAFSIVALACSKGLSVGEMSRQHPAELRVTTAVAVANFALAHARNPHRGAYAQAAVILVEQAILPSSYSRQFLSHGIAAAAGSHMTHNLMALLLTDLAVVLEAASPHSEGLGATTQPALHQALTGLCATALLITLLGVGLHVVGQSGTNTQR